MTDTDAIVDTLTDTLEKAVADLPLEDYSAVLDGLAAEVRRQQEAVVVDRRRAGHFTVPPRRIG